MNFLTMSILLLCTLFPAEMFSIVALVVFFAYVSWLLYRKPELCVKYFPFWFTIIANIFGVAVCEFGNVELVELVTVSHYTGSLPLIILSRWLFVVCLVLADSLFFHECGIQATTHKLNEHSKWVNILAIISLMFFVAALVDVTRFPSARISGINRFVWDSTYTDSLFLPSIVTSNLVHLVFFSALATRFGNKKIGIVGTLLFVIYLFWTGEKFGGYFQVFYLYLWAFFDIFLNIGVKKLRLAVAGCLVVLLCFTGVAVFIQGFSSSNTYSGTQFLTNRLAQQGQLWWKTYEQTHEPHISEFSNEIDVILHGDSTEANNHIGSKQGMYMIMYYTAPSDVIDKKLSTGSTYSEAGYAVCLYYFGVAGPLVFSIVMAILISFLVNVMLKALSLGRYFESMLEQRLTYFSLILLSGFGWSLFSKSALLTYGILIILHFLEKRGIIRLLDNKPRGAHCRF